MSYATEELGILIILIKIIMMKLMKKRKWDLEEGIPMHRMGAIDFQIR